MEFVLAAFLFIGTAIFVAVRRGLQVRHLAERGETTRGRIERIWGHTGSTGTTRHRLRYRYSVTGCDYSHTILVSPGERERMQEGGEVDVVYLPDKPKVSALSEMVEQARTALRK